MSGTTNANPLISVGFINRLRGSITVPSFTALNVTAPYLGKEGISITLEGEGVEYLPAMTAGVPSPVPYQMARIRFPLLKSQNLAAQYKLQYESIAMIGQVNVKGDSSTLPTYSFLNVSIVNNGSDQRYNGDDANFPVELRGMYLINNSMWNPV